MPESGTASYGEISIAVEKIQEKEGFVLRKLTLKVILDENETCFLQLPTSLGQVDIDCRNFKW